MDPASNSKEGCPLKGKGCPVTDEIRRLKEECKRLQVLTQVDTLTGLYNFNYLQTALEDEMERTRRNGLPTSLIMLDLDHFKRVNDRYGHEAGNRALQWLSNLLRVNLRRIDIACRYGGEEFALILPGIRLSQAVNVAERLRVGLEGSPAEIDGEFLRVTASFGVDEYRGREDISVEGFIKRVDYNLLEAKAKGRNQVCYDKGKVSEEATEVTIAERESLFLPLGVEKQTT